MMLLIDVFPEWAFPIKRTFFLAIVIGGMEVDLYEVLNSNGRGDLCSTKSHEDQWKFQPISLFTSSQR